MKNLFFFISLILLIILLGVTVSYSQVIFKNISDSAGISAPNSQSYSFSSMWVDIDNDDYLDLYVAHGSGNGNEFNQLFHNLRNGKFEDIRATAFPSANPSYTGQMCWGDFNNDGFIDCYESHFPTSDDWLWMNNGDMTFKDVRNIFHQPGRYATGAIFSDINSDGKLDLLINTQGFQGTSIEINNGNSFDLSTPFYNGGQGDEILTTYINDDSIPDYMFGNARGLDSLFFSSAKGSFVGFDNSFLKAVRQLSDYPGAAAFADIDNDGYPDLLVHYPNKLYVFHDIQGKSFVDWTHDLGLDSAKNGTHITIFFYDFDNDGYLDLFLMNEDAVSQIYYGSATGFKTPTNLPINNPPTGGLHNASLTDYDNDGFIDIEHNGVGTVELWHNEGNANRWLNVKLRGHQANSNGIGSRVIAYSEGRRQNREVGYTQGNYGYLPLMAHFGFGSGGCSASSTVIDSVVVIWQPGGRQVIPNVRYNELVVIDQDSGIVRSIQRPLTTSYGYIFPYFLGAHTTYADTTVEVPMAVSMPQSFVQLGLKPDEITFGLEYNSDIIDISSTKISAHYVPPAGWLYKSSIAGKDSLIITILNSGGSVIGDSLFLGTLRFDTYKAVAKGTYIFLNELDVRSKGTSYSFCHNFEGDFLGEVVIIDRPVIPDTLSPLFQNQPVSLRSQKNLIVHDDRTTDQGLRSISWRALSGTDSTKFDAFYTPALIPCFSDKFPHYLTLKQLDSSVSGCFEFTFEDCDGNKSMDTLCIAAYGSTGVTERNATGYGLQINPNPSTGNPVTLRLTSPKPSSVDLTLHDMLGNLVFTYKGEGAVERVGIQNFIVPTAQLSGGTYLVTLRTGESVLTGKITVVK